MSSIGLQRPDRPMDDLFDRVLRIALHGPDRSHGDMIVCRACAALAASQIGLITKKSHDKRPARRGER